MKIKNIAHSSYIAKSATPLPFERIYRFLTPVFTEENIRSRSNTDSILVVRNKTEGLKAVPISNYNFPYTFEKGEGFHLEFYSTDLHYYQVLALLNSCFIKHELGNKLLFKNILSFDIPLGNDYQNNQIINLTKGLSDTFIMSDLRDRFNLGLNINKNIYFELITNKINRLNSLLFFEIVYPELSFYGKTQFLFRLLDDIGVTDMPINLSSFIRLLNIIDDSRSKLYEYFSNWHYRLSYHKYIQTHTKALSKYESKSIYKSVPK